MNCFKTICIYLVFAVALIAGRAPLFAATPTRKPQEGRLLFLIETTAGTDNERTAIRKVMRSIVESGLDGHMHYGDTIGLWTYNEKVNTDFPMVIWTHERHQDVENAMDFWMMKQKFKGNPDFSKVLAPLQRVINVSEKLTIIWISTGESKITNTPFDSEIAELQKEFHDDFRKQHIPFVTLLAVRKGAVVDFTVNPGDAKLRLPEIFEKEAAVAAAAVTNTPPPQATAPVAKRPPLIIHVGPSPELLAEKKGNAITATNSVITTNAAATNAAVPKLTTNAVAPAQPTVQPNAPAAVATKAAVPVAAKSVTNTVAAQTNIAAVVTNKPVVINNTAPVAVVPKTNATPLAAVLTNSSTQSTPVVSKPKPAPAVSTPAVAPRAEATVVYAHPALIAIGCVIFVIIAFAVVFFVKKSSVPKGPSLISQSMTRERFKSDESKPSSDKPAGPE